MYVQIRKNKRVYLISANGLIQTSSEQYATRWNAKRAAKRMFPTLQILDYDGVVVQAGGS